MQSKGFGYTGYGGALKIRQFHRPFDHFCAQDRCVQAVREKIRASRVFQGGTPSSKFSKAARVSRQNVVEEIAEYRCAILIFSRNRKDDKEGE